MCAELRHALLVSFWTLCLFLMALWLVCCVPGLGCRGGGGGDSGGGGGFGCWWASDPEHAKLQGITGVVLDDSTVI